MTKCNRFNCYEDGKSVKIKWHDVYINLYLCEKHFKEMHEKRERLNND